MQCSGRLRARLFPQVQLYAFHNCRRFTGILVYGDTARCRCVISGSGRRIIAVNRLVARKIPFGFYLRIPKPFLQCGQGTFDVCLGCFRSLVFHGCAYTAPFGKRIKSAVILGIGDALQGHGIYRTGAVGRRRDIPSGHAASNCPVRGFGSQGSRQLFLRKGKRCVHRFHRHPFRRQLPGPGHSIGSLYSILFIHRLILKVIGIRIYSVNRCIRAVIRYSRYAVYIQRVPGHPGP